MSASSEWWDYHLTPEGWVEGDEKLDFGGMTERSTPEDRVATYTYSEKLPSAYSKHLSCRWNCHWECDDKEEISRLLKLHGSHPSKHIEKNVNCN